MSPPSVSTIIVAHDSLADLRRTLPPLLSQLHHSDELIVVDSGSSDGIGEQLSALAPSARLVKAAGNVGFAAGANLGAASARGDLLVFLNPDALVQGGWADAIREPWGVGWCAWMALVLMDGGRAINTSGGVLHFTGLGWAGQAHESVELAPLEPMEVGFLSGACLAIPRSRWDELGGFPEEFFMYGEDVDMSLRLRLRGCRLAVVPRARVIHDYEFDRGASKWRLLERNRWATLLRTYPTLLLALLTPALVATEVVIWLVAIRGGWLRMKAAATADLIRALPRLLAERAAIQRTRGVTARQFASGLDPALSSPYLGRLGRQPLVALLLRAYWRAAVALLR